MKRTRRRRVRYTKRDLLLDLLIAVVWFGFWAFIVCKALHVFAAPAPVDFRIRDGIQTGTRIYAELVTLDRQELADMRAAEEWTEPVAVVVYVPETRPETVAETVPAPAPAPETEPAPEPAQISEQVAETEPAPETAPAPSTSRFTERERYLLLHIMMHEAGNQGVIGQALVGRVVLNRVESGRFPGSIEEVLFQPGQFGPEPEICRYEPNADSYAALELLEAGWNESQGALFFESGGGFSWATFLFQYGGHRFYTV